MLLGANGKTRAATIKIGKTDNANTQVLSGIAQGDVVVLGVKSNAGAIALPTPTASSN